MSLDQNIDPGTRSMGKDLKWAEERKEGEEDIIKLYLNIMNENFASVNI